MIFDLETDNLPGDGPADICIVGAGAAGISLAVELAGSGLDVLLLESGGLREEAPSQDLYGSEVAGLRHAGIHQGRFRVFGGTTTRWGGQILELFDEDFAHRPWIPGSGWPLRKTELAPYYARAIELEGLGRANGSDAAVWREIGLTEPALGPDLEPYLSRWCPEPNFAVLHRQVLRRSPHVRVCLHANACRLLLAEDGATVEGVVARTLTGREAVFRAGSYVLCQGGIETSRFLLQPQPGPAPPWQRSGLLGRHFQDHACVGFADLLELRPGTFSDYFDGIVSRGFKYQPRFRLPLEDQRREGILNVAGAICWVVPEDAPLPQIKQVGKHVLRGRWGQLQPGDGAVLLRHLPALARQVYHFRVRRRMYTPPSYPVRLGVSCEQEPLGASRVTLSDEKDALGLFRARLDWRVSDLELRTLIVFARKVREAFTRLGLARVVMDEGILDDLELVRSRADDSNHHMGGARMAASAAAGVVDLDLKIHGTTNAYLCSAAVFPTSGFSNPTQTLLALTLRLADHFKALLAEERAPAGLACGSR